MGEEEEEEDNFGIALEALESLEGARTPWGGGGGGGDAVFVGAGLDRPAVAELRAAICFGCAITSAVDVFETLRAFRAAGTSTGVAAAAAAAAMGWPHGPVISKGGGADG